MKKLFASLLLTVAFGAGAQTLLGGAEFSAKLPASFSVGAGVEYRSANWFDNTDQWSVDASVGYKPLKFLKFSAGYKFIQKNNPAGVTKKGLYGEYWDAKHRVSVSATGSLKVWKLTLSLRERYQYTLRPSHVIPFLDAEDGNRVINKKSTHILRSRLQASFKPRKKCRWEPFVNFELYSMLREVNHTKDQTLGGKFYDKWRIAAGTEFKINKHNSLELFYRYARSVDEDENDASHTIALVYSFSL